MKSDHAAKVTYRIVVADDHPLFREALTGRLRRILAEVEIVEVEDLTGLQDAISGRDDIDLLLLDLNMPGTQGLSALVHARALAPGIAVVVVSAMEDAAMVHRAIGLGAAGYIPKSADISEIGRVLTEVLEGRIGIPARYQGDSAEHPLSTAETDAARRVGQLTPQQYRIAVMLAAGRLNKQIAWELDITEATVKVHMSTILRKLGAQNRTQVALMVQMLDFERSTGSATLPDEIHRH